jgi:hypothetical protein
MKQFFSLSTLALGALIASPSYADDTQVHLPKLNLVLSDVIKESFEKDELVKSLFIRFDESKTTLEYEKLRVAAQAGGSVARTPWDKAVSSFAVGVDLQAKNVGDAKAHTEALLSLNARTQVLKLTSYVARELVKDSSGEIPEDADEARALEIVKDLQTTTSLDQLHTALLELHAIVLRKEPELAKNLILLAGLKNDRVESLTLRYTQRKEAFFGIRNIVAQLKLTSTGAKASLKFATIYPEEIKEMLESAKTYLLEIQNRSEERLAEVKSFAQQMRDALAQLVKEGEEFLDLGAGI